MSHASAMRLLATVEAYRAQRDEAMKIVAAVADPDRCLENAVGGCSFCGAFETHDVDCHITRARALLGE